MENLRETKSFQTKIYRKNLFFNVNVMSGCVLKVKTQSGAILKKADWKTIFFLAVIVFAVFVRVYKFDDLLLFKGDAFRDAVMVSRAYENGPGELPLLGPRAGGTKLRLGPAFYYSQYLSAIAFKSVSPPVLAYPTVLFSLL